MRSQNWLGILAVPVLAATVGVAAHASPAAQQPAEPSAQPPATAQEPATPSPATPSPQSSDARKVTVAGCLQQAPSGPVGTSGSEAAPPAATAGAEKASGEVTKLVLNVVPSAAEGAASASDSSAPRSYRLIANEAALSPHVGKKLELSGTIEESSAPSSAANAPMLRVEAGKVIGESCTS
jgi:hypothetical protein